MSANTNAVQNTVVLGYHIMLTLAYCTLDTRILTCFHYKYFLFCKIRLVRRDFSISQSFRFIHFFIVMNAVFSFQCLFSVISHDSHNKWVYYNRTLEREYVTSSNASVFTPMQKRIPNNPYIIAARLYPGAFAVVNIT